MKIVEFHLSNNYIIFAIINVFLLKHKENDKFKHFVMISEKYKIQHNHF